MMIQNEDDLAEFDDLGVPRYKYAQSEAGRTWEKLGEGVIPVDPRLIAENMGILLKEEIMPVGIHSDGVSQMVSNGKCIIRYRQGISKERARFTIAHELGHILLEHISFDGSCSQYSSNAQEKEADAFAGALLVPAKDLRAYMKGGNRSFAEILARYMVSRQAMYIAIDQNKLVKKVKV